jgi:hypothetical protein
MEFLTIAHSEDRWKLIDLLLSHTDTVLSPPLENEYSLSSDVTDNVFSLQRVGFGFVTLWTHSDLDLVTDQTKRRIFQKILSSPFLDSVMKLMSLACVDTSLWKERGYFSSRKWIPSTVTDAIHQVLWIRSLEQNG